MARNIASDERYNTRRRAKRYVAKLEKEAANLTGRAKQAQLNYINGLKNVISNSYVSRNATPEQRAATEKAQRVLEQNVTSDVRKNEQSRRNAVFQRELNLSSAGRGSTLGNDIKAQAYAKTFYRATQKYWDGLPNSDRNKAIMNALGTDSLEEAFYQVLYKNREIVKAVKAYERGEVDSIDEYFTQDKSSVDNEGSPDYLDFVKPLEL